MFVFRPSNRPKARRGGPLGPPDRLEPRDLPALVVPLASADPPPVRWPGADGGDPDLIPPWARGNAGGSSAEFTTQFTAPPPLQVLQIQRRGLHAARSRFTVVYDQPVDPARGLNPANYVLIGEGPDLALGTADDVPVRLRSVVGDASGTNVTLVTARPVPLVGREYVLGIDGNPSTGVVSDQGGLLDGNNGPGTDAFQIVNVDNFVPSAALTRAIRTPSGKHRTPATGIVRNG